jgi:hypothetical protein
MALLRMIASWGENDPRRDSGIPAGTLVYSAVSPGISRVFRGLQEINRILCPILTGLSLNNPV